jgi:hypothetical protein
MEFPSTRKSGDLLKEAPLISFLRIPVGESRGNSTRKLC